MGCMSSQVNWTRIRTIKSSKGSSLHRDSEFFSGCESINELFRDFYCCCQSLVREQVPEFMSYHSTDKQSEFSIIMFTGTEQGVDIMAGLPFSFFYCCHDDFF